MVYTDINIAINSKINHIMVSFADHYNAISIDRLSSKTRIGRDSRYFNNSFLCKFKFSSPTKNLFLFIKNTKKQPLLSKWEYTKPCFKENARTFSKNPATQENIRISRLKKRRRNLYKKQNFKPKIKLENLKDDFIS